MYVWLVCFVVLFGLAELYPWVQGVVLPFPLMLLAGVGLAIASNLNISNLSASNHSISHSSASNLTASSPNSRNDLPEQTAPVPDAETQIAPAAAPPPPQALASPPPDSISFTIRKH